jgi:hypothetical protein
LACLALLVYAAHRWLPPVEGDAAVDALKPPTRPVADSVELQIALARAGFSPGSIDGLPEQQTSQALFAYQQAHGLPPSGEFDTATRTALKIRDPVYQRIKLTADDFEQIDPPPLSWKERGTRPRMAYHSILEKIAEQSMSDPDLIRQLNPELDFQALAPGSRIVVPHMRPLRLPRPARHLRISLRDRKSVV